MNKKGIAPVITILLILIIGVSISAVLIGFFNHLFPYTKNVPTYNAIVLDRYGSECLVSYTDGDINKRAIVVECKHLEGESMPIYYDNGRQWWIEVE